MIHVSKNQLTQVEYLLSQSARGNHVLFDAESLKRALDRAARRLGPLTDEEAYAAEPHLERLLEEPSLERKRAYLEQLDAQSYDRVVMTYFTIVENNLLETSEVRH